MEVFRRMPTSSLTIEGHTSMDDGLEARKLQQSPLHIDMNRLKPGIGKQQCLVSVAFSREIGVLIHDRRD